MSYFKKIVERTLKVDVKLDSGSVKPAITPDSIPEPFEIKPRPGTPARRNAAPSTSGSANKQQANTPRPAANSKVAGEEERLPEQGVSTAAAATAVAAPVSPAKQVAQTSPRDKAAASDPEIMPGSEQVDVPSTEKERNPDHDVAPSLVSSSSSSSLPVVLYAATEAGVADRASQTKPLDRRGIVSKDSPRSEHHPQLRPSNGAYDRYSVDVTQPDETTVTINIGRIEVRAISPVVERQPLPRKEYSPPLSLGEYLKQRSEGKKK
jgi:hypothetical protein